MNMRFSRLQGTDQLHVNGDLSQGLVEYNFGMMETPFGYIFDFIS